MTGTLIFVVDGGASKTEAELRRADGFVIGRHRAGPCNLYQDPDGGVAAIEACWQACAGPQGVNPALVTISAGLAGTGSPAGRAQFYQSHSGFCRVLLSSDGYAALVGAFGGSPGALLSIGTGAVGCRFDRQERFTQIGGWGFLAGDRGGGAWLGREFVSAWLEHRDAGGAAGGMWDYVQDRVGENRPDILAWLREATPGQFAALVPGLNWAADSGDPTALALLQEAGRHLARLAQATVAETGLPLALSGGLSPAISSYLSGALAQAGSAIRLAEINASALEGAWRIAVGDRPAEFAACAAPGAAE